MNSVSKKSQSQGHLALRLAVVGLLLATPLSLSFSKRTCEESGKTASIFPRLIPHIKFRSRRS